MNTIALEFNIGDKAFVMYNNIIQRGVVIRAEVAQTKDRPTSVRYMLRLLEGDCYFHANKVFKTIDAQTESLKSNYLDEERRNYENTRQD